MEILVYIGYMVAGSLMKLTDEIADGKLRIDAHKRGGIKWIDIASRIDIISGIIYGSIMGLLISHNITSVYVLGAIIIGCLITGKVDARGHYFALAAIILVIFSLGVESVTLPILLLVALSSVFDEMANDRYKSFKNKAVNFFFRYRMTMKLLLLIFSVLHILDYYSIIFLLVFDFSYYLTEVILRRF